MDSVLQKVETVASEKAVELIESKSETIQKGVDAVSDAVQDTADSVAEKVEDKLEAIGKPVTDVLEKLEENPEVKKVVDALTASVVQQIDGREVSCGCFGWMFALRITRKSRQPSPSKSEVTESKLPEAPPQREEVKETPQPTPPVETQSDLPPSAETSASS